MPASRPSPPSQAELTACYDVAVPDLVGPDLRILFCGINPSLWSGWSGMHFGRPSNRLWLVLEQAGLTPRRLAPEETSELLAAGIGITNLVNRATARADELADEELWMGAPRLAATAAQWRPAVVAVLGLTAYRKAFRQPKAVAGEQTGGIGPSRLWLLPNPSGLNAGYQLPELISLYSELPAL